MKGRRWIGLRAALVLVVALLLQLTVVSDLRVAGVIGDLMLALVVAAGMTGGADRGVVYGFAAGLLYDLLLDTPFGLSALTYALVGYAVGLAGSALLRTSGWWPVVIAAVAGAVQATLYTSLGNLVGVAYPFGDLPAIALVMAGWCALLVLPLIRVMWWVHGHAEPDRLEVLLR
ncbi:MAG TPA: rod shape-determining protein MreD [Acidimicrobiales bacterium]|nr:rod shape-determining protein MreD [Acidimicrobiales bacterium]